MSSSSQTDTLVVTQSCGTSSHGRRAVESQSNRSRNVVVKPLPECVNYFDIRRLQTLGRPDPCRYSWCA